MEKYFDFLLDYRMLKPSYSLHLLSKHESRQFEDTVANLLPLPASILGADKLKGEIEELLNRKENESTMVRSRYGHILEKIFTFADGIKYNEKRMSGFASKFVFSLTVRFSKEIMCPSNRRISSSVVNREVCQNTTSTASDDRR